MLRLAENGFPAYDFSKGGRILCTNELYDRDSSHDSAIAATLRTLVVLLCRQAGFVRHSMLGDKNDVRSNAMWTTRVSTRVRGEALFCDRADER